MFRLLLLPMLFFLVVTNLFGQDPYTRINDINMQPEVWHFSGVVSADVDAKGDLNQGGIYYEI